MRILLTGSHGLIGSSLQPLLLEKGHTVITLVRRPPTDANELFWDPAKGELAKESLEGFDAVIHLAGENIAAKRWSSSVKKTIRDSRVQSTTLLCQTLKELQSPPSTLLCASAVGFYGEGGEETLDETSPMGNKFLSEVVREWEDATHILKQTRVVNLRFGTILSPHGGALAKLLPPFRMGSGGPIGDGNQWMSWIDIEDVLSAIDFLLQHKEISGPCNITSPNPVTHREFAKTLGQVIGKPAFIHVPAFVAKVLFGEMAEELLLISARCVPKRLQEAGFSFQYPFLHESLLHLLHPV